MRYRQVFSVLIAFACGLATGYLGNDLVEFVKSDGCLDRGGAWDYQFDNCKFQ